MRYDQMPKAYLILLEVPDGKGNTYQIPFFNHGWETRAQAEAQVEASVEQGSFTRLQLTIATFPIVPKDDA